MTFRTKRFVSFLCFVCLVSVSAGAVLEACSRVLYKSNDGKFIVVGRNMDWAEDLESNMWIMPRGVKRNGLAAQNSLEWTAKYGSVIVSGYDLAATDGINEAGLDANLLWLGESDYGKRDPKRPGLCISLWLQFCLDSFATVQEAVDYFQAHDIQLLPASVGIEEKRLVTVHISLADKSGDSAVIECTDGHLKVYHGNQTRVMTNSPTFDKQLEGLRAYEGFGGSQELPGTTKAADRFVRAAYYLQRLPAPADERNAVAGVLGVMRNVAQPFGPKTPGEPNTSATLWRTVADLTNEVYYYESTFRPNIVWVKLKELDFTRSQKLDLVHGGDLVGDVSKDFQDAKPFVPQSPDKE